MFLSSGMNYRMENLMDDALNIQKLLPWIESDEDIINFLRRVPLDNSHLRKQLTIYHFLKKRDNEERNVEQQIEDDAREIVIMLPDVPYKDIKERLSVLGNIPNRKEVVLRQLLLNNKDVEKVLYEMYFNSRNKRKSDTISDHEDLNDSETNINIKIRRVEGTLEVVSSIKQEKLTSPQLKRTVQRPQVEQENPADEDLLQLPRSSRVSSSNYPKPCTAVCSTTRAGKDLHKLLNQNEDSMSSIDSSETTELSNSSEEINYVNNDEVTAAAPTSDVLNNNVSEPEKFDLIQYLKEVTQIDEKKVRTICQNHNVPLDKKPDVQLLNQLVNSVMDDNNELIVLDDSRVSIASDLDSSEAEDKVLNLSRPALRHPATPCEHRTLPTPYNTSGHPDSTTTTANARRDAPPTDSSPPIVLGSKRKIIAPAKLLPGKTPAEPLSLTKKVVLQPARLLPPPKMEPEEIPALPQQYLSRAASTAQEWEVNSDVEVEPGPSSGVSNKKKKIVDDKLVFRLMEMFPNACPDYIRKVCEGRTWPEFDDVVTDILSNEDHPKRPQKPQSPPREMTIEDQLEIVKALLPDADPTFLRCRVEAFEGDSERLNEFIVEANETKDYPTMKEYLRKQKLTAQSKQYTSEFNVENFVQLFPEPGKTFDDPKRTVKVDNYTCLYILNFFQNKFDTISIKTIRTVLTEKAYRIVPSNNVLLEHFKANRTLKNRRKHTANLDDIPQNIGVLQELAYLTHQDDIETYIKEKKEKEESDRRHAKENNLMNTCACCFDEEVMPKDTFSCPNGCMFCRHCIQKSCEVAVGEAKNVFKCIGGCDVEFTLQTLQNVLPPKMFSNLAQKKTVAEAKAAGIELVSCPFCYFASIPNEHDKIFHCLNEDCMKESCRFCQLENHIPYKCDEVEKDADVKARTYVENKMTEALLRKCWKCGMSFFKEEGCNKMTCTCGAQMCYICKSPVTDYSHFNGIGGDKYHLCPLYSDSNAVNKENVIGAAEAAKAEIDSSRLKVDPSADIVQHFEERRKVLPREPHLELINVALNLQHVRHDHQQGHQHQQAHQHGHQRRHQHGHQHRHQQEHQQGHPNRQQGHPERHRHIQAQVNNQGRGAMLAPPAVVPLQVNAPAFPGQVEDVVQARLAQGAIPRRPPNENAAPPPIQGQVIVNRNNVLAVNPVRERMDEGAVPRRPPDDNALPPQIPGHVQVGNVIVNFVREIVTQGTVPRRPPNENAAPPQFPGQVRNENVIFQGAVPNRPLPAQIQENLAIPDQVELQRNNVVEREVNERINEESSRTTSTKSPTGCGSTKKSSAPTSCESESPKRTKPKSKSSSANSARLLENSAKSTERETPTESRSFASCGRTTRSSVKSTGGCASSVSTASRRSSRGPATSAGTGETSASRYKTRSASIEDKSRSAARLCEPSGRATRAGCSKKKKERLS